MSPPVLLFPAQAGAATSSDAAFFAPIFAETYWFWIPPRASTMAAHVDAVTLLWLSFSAFFGLLIAGLIIFFAVYYRRKEHDAEYPEPILGLVELELLWSVGPLLILLVLFGWGAAVYYRVVLPPDDAMEIYVVGKQWMWKIQHPGGKSEINELHVPLGRPVKLIMISEDVIHSFGVPAFRLKQDVLPGRYTTLWFEANRRGRYHLFCTEYCGVKHSQMIGQVVVLDPVDYQSWLSERTDAPMAGSSERDGRRLLAAPTERIETQALAASENREEPPMAVQGEAHFQRLQCNGCHNEQDDLRIGPSLKGRFGQPVQLATGRMVTFDEQHIRQAILNPLSRPVAGYPSIMPTYTGQLSEKEIMAIIHYLKSSSGDETL